MLINYVTDTLPFSVLIFSFNRLVLTILQAFDRIKIVKLNSVYWKSVTENCIRVKNVAIYTVVDINLNSIQEIDENKRKKI